MEENKEISGDDAFLPDVEDPVPQSVSLDDDQFHLVLARLAGRDAEVRSPVQIGDRIALGDKPRTIEVAGQEIAIPQKASARAWALETRPGLLVEAADPKPNGTWIWIAGSAAREINELLRALDAS